MGKYSASEEQTIRSVEYELSADKGIVEELGEEFGALPTPEEDLPEPDVDDEVYEVSFK